MTTLERGTTIVPLYSKDYTDKLRSLREQYEAALRAEASGGDRRVGTKSKAAALATEHDNLQDNPEDHDVINVELREISNTEWQQLADEYPPRHGEVGDKRIGVNLSTFPSALLRKALVTDLNLDELSRARYLRLEGAAWDLHNGDDALGKLSLVSLHKQPRDQDSKPLDDSE